MDLDSIGSRCKTARHHRRLTQQQVADRLGMARQNYTRIECDQMGLMVAHLLKLAEIFDVPAAALLPKRAVPNPEEEGT